MMSYFCSVRDDDGKDVWSCFTWLYGSRSDNVGDVRMRMLKGGADVDGVMPSGNATPLPEEGG